MLNVSLIETQEDGHAFVEDQNMEIDPSIDEGISCMHEVDKEKNVAERVEMHVDAQVPMEEQNRGADPRKDIDETINVSHVSEMVGLHDNAQEANEETNGEFTYLMGLSTNLLHGGIPFSISKLKQLELLYLLSKMHNNTVAAVAVHDNVGKLEVDHCIPWLQHSDVSVSFEFDFLGLNEIKGLKVHVSSVETNIVSSLVMIA
ncbi:hypothetical protein RHSIM_RhsimUnG0164700 [Rhododendron simsii]|uniref:Uncharacterized protein n=1 Tax=Rhododendron simsii TaxID=118357 RepID=A0A834FWF4_RHOSS|nr:hypothetical protein RHSIM_RhsimUnG0164700 [Rhododendron simsii]